MSRCNRSFLAVLILLIGVVNGSSLPPDVSRLSDTTIRDYLDDSQRDMFYSQHPNIPYTLAERSISTSSASEDNKKSRTCPHEPTCRCNRNQRRAYCKNLDYVPRLPSYVTEFALYNGNLGWVNASTLRNLTDVNLQSLILRDCRISAYHGDVFGSLSNLTNLDLTGNLYAHVDQLCAALSYLNNSLLQSLTLDHCGIHSISASDSMFNALSGCNITVLSIKRNGLKIFIGDYVSMLTQLQTLNLDDNRITEFGTPSLDNLVVLTIENNRIRDFPTFYANGRALLPNLRVLNLNRNRLPMIENEQLMGLTNLIELYLNSNFLGEIDVNFLLHTPKLEVLEIERCRVSKMSVNSFKSSTLILLNFQSNSMHISFKRHKYLFTKLPNLQRIILTDNNLGALYGRKSERFFGGFKKLRRLEVMDCFLRELTRNFTRIMPSLEVVIATGNKIDNWSPETFAFAPNLTRLYLDNNFVRIINKTSFPQKVLQQLVKLNLGGNLFDCTCDLMWFRDFLRTTKIQIVNLNATRAQYKCNTPTIWKDKPLLSYNPTVKSCTIYTLNLALVLGATLGGFTFFLLILSSVIYRKRWYLKYWCHVVTAKMSKYELLDGGIFQYDAFVSYNSADRLWVLRTLVPTIESKGYKLCLMDRDFIPGQYVIDNIVEGIESSRRVILVLSDNFTQSEWCKWEVTMAQHKNLRDGNRGLVLLKYKDLTSGLVSRTLAALIRERTYIEWSEDEMCERLFWEQLEATLTVPAAVQPA